MSKNQLALYCAVFDLFKSGFVKDISVNCISIMAM